MAKVEGVLQVSRAIGKLASKAEKASVIVGYTANYAVFSSMKLSA